MKKFVSAVCGVILCITVAIGWYSANHQSLIVGIGVSPTGTNGQLLVGKDSFSVNMALDESRQLEPVTSKNGKTFYTCENGALTANTATQDGVSYVPCDSGYIEETKRYKLERLDKRIHPIVCPTCGITMDEKHDVCPICGRKM